ncbi:MAG: anhydro-N-acetylmuramic acid kinase [Nitrospirota bacterium]
MNVVGLMSGTSGDGVDAALVSIAPAARGLRVRLRAFAPTPYPPRLRRRILDAASHGTVAEICHLNAVLGEWFARGALKVIERAGLRPSDVDLIGSHGQTVHHRPQPVREPGLGLIRSTLQIAEPCIIAERTGITTVADFRPRDLAAGGEGAPLTPYVHHLLFRNARVSRLIANLGGIGNVTYLPAGGDLDSIRAFDTGPGNMVLDALAHRLTRGRLAMDRNGRIAARGAVDPLLLAELLAHPFFTRRPPKTTGREEFGEPFLARVLSHMRRRKLAPEDVMATCTLLTAAAIGGARRWLKGTIDEVVVGGGGVRNRSLMRDLGSVFAPTPVRTFEDLGWSSKAFESAAFAVLAYQAMQGEGTNVPSVTGASHPVVLGKIVPGSRVRTGTRR